MQSRVSTTKEKFSNIIKFLFYLLLLEFKSPLIVSDSNPLNTTGVEKKKSAIKALSCLTNFQ